MIEVARLIVGGLRANCYLVWDKKSREAVIIDPGDEADYIIEKINELDLRPQKIVATHGHFDHVMAVNELKLALQAQAGFKIPFLMHKKDERILRWMRRSAIYFTKVDPGPKPEANENIKEGVVIKAGEIELRVIETPGHTLGGVCLYCPKEKILFSGDTIFAEGAVGRTDFPYCSKAELKKSIKKLLKLPEETKVFPGHGEETTILEWKAFFRHDS
jgi:hydroxyacylglutathione hydrolase